MYDEEALERALYGRLENLKGSVHKYFSRWGIDLWLCRSSKPIQASSSTDIPYGYRI